MPFGYSRDIFKYPPVQYIPLNRLNEKTLKTTRTNEKQKFYVYDHLEKIKLAKKLNFLQYPDSYPIPEGQFAILSLNCIITLIQYRGYEVTMVCRPDPGKYQIFTITDKYFYKDKLIFILYDGQTSERLDFFRYEFKPQNNVLTTIYNKCYNNNSSPHQSKNST